MKITHTIVKPDGFCYGMVMPEKYDESMFTTIAYRAYQETENRKVLQSAKDAAIRYEDQDKAVEVVKSIARAPIKHDFVYPLPEPMDAEIVVILCKKEDCQFDGECKAEIEGRVCKGKRVLRISQGTDREPLDTGPFETAYRQMMAQPNCDSAHMYTEGSEPTERLCEYCGYSAPIGVVKSTCPDCPRTVGVEEKKEPDYDRDQFLNERDSVSEREEPTQEELWNEVDQLINLSSGGPTMLARMQFTITRRA